MRKLKKYLRFGHVYLKEIISIVAIVVLVTASFMYLKPKEEDIRVEENVSVPENIDYESSKQEEPAEVDINSLDVMECESVNIHNPRTVANYYYNEIPKVDLGTREVLTVNVTEDISIVITELEGKIYNRSRMVTQLEEIRLGKNEDGSYFVIGINEDRSMVLITFGEEIKIDVVPYADIILVQDANTNDVYKTTNKYTYVKSVNDIRCFRRNKLQAQFKLDENETFKQLKGLFFVTSKGRLGMLMTYECNSIVNIEPIWIDGDSQNKVEKINFIFRTNEGYTFPVYTQGDKRKIALIKMNEGEYPNAIEFQNLEVEITLTDFEKDIFLIEEFDTSNVLARFKLDDDGFWKVEYLYNDGNLKGKFIREANVNLNVVNQLMTQQDESGLLDLMYYDEVKEKELELLKCQERVVKERQEEVKKFFKDNPNLDSGDKKSTKWGYAKVKRMIYNNKKK